MRKIDVKNGDLTVNQLLEGVEAGERVDVMDGERRLARLYREPTKISETEREAAIARMVDRMRRGISLGGGALPPRDARYER